MTAEPRTYTNDELQKLVIRTLEKPSDDGLFAVANLAIFLLQEREAMRVLLDYADAQLEGTGSVVEGRSGTDEEPSGETSC